MNRRKLLALIGLAPVAVVVPALANPVERSIDPPMLDFNAEPTWPREVYARQSQRYGLLLMHQEDESQNGMYGFDGRRLT